MPDTRYIPPVFQEHATVTGAQLNAGLDAFGVAINAAGAPPVGPIGTDRLSRRFRLPNTRMLYPKSLSASTWFHPSSGKSYVVATSSVISAPVVVEEPWDLLELQLSVGTFVSFDVTDLVSAKLYTDPGCTLEMGAGTLPWPIVYAATPSLFACTSMRPAGGAGTPTHTPLKGTAIYLKIFVITTGQTYPAVAGFAEHISVTLWKAIRHGR